MRIGSGLASAVALCCWLAHWSGGDVNAASALGALSGRVLSRGTGGPIAGATVVIVDGPDAGKEAVTANDGRYQIDGLASGGFTVRASAAGFDDSAQGVSLPDASMQLDWRMKRAACKHSSCAETPSECNETLPLFEKPFDGNPRTTNLLDHKYPFQFEDTDPRFVSYCGGGNRSGRVNGHSGYDWLLPVGRPLLAVADGTITFAGTESSFFCPPLGRTVAGKFVELQTRSPNGELFWVQYVHVSQLVATRGQTVRAGDTIALSGNTGCSTAPHLHFQVFRQFGNQQGRSARIDPYGWQGSGKDPWTLKAAGGPSVWLWIRPPHTQSLETETPVLPAAEEILDMNNIPEPPQPPPLTPRRGAS